MEGSKLIYDITQLTNTKLVTNAYEVIKNLPGIMEYNGTLTLAGSGSVNILLNDKVSSMTYEQILTLLKSMPASRVEKVEIMYTTPPQYHVRGASINIHTPKHKTDEGKLQGEINGSYSQKQQSDGEGGITLAYTSKKFDADFTYHLLMNTAVRVIVWKLSIQSMATNTMSAKTSPEKVEATRIC